MAAASAPQKITEPCLQSGIQSLQGAQWHCLKMPATRRLPIRQVPKGVRIDSSPGEHTLCSMPAAGLSAVQAAASSNTSQQRQTAATGGRNLHHSSRTQAGLQPDHWLKYQPLPTSQLSVAHLLLLRRMSSTVR